MEITTSQDTLQTIPVTTEEQLKAFHQVPFFIYQDDDQWVPPLQSDIEQIFDPSTNPYFEHGDAERWILKDKTGQLLGRIAAFVNYEKNQFLEVPTGGLGFFECINNKKAAHTLFRTGERWLTHHGVIHVEAPINFGENHEYWGLLIKGFTRPSYGMNYNPPYYRSLFNSYNFTLAYRQYTNELDLSAPLPRRFSVIAQRVMEKPQYHFTSFQQRYVQQYAEDFCQIYNKAWQFHQKFAPITPDYILKQFQQMKPILDKDLMWFAYADDQPIGFLLALPDINQVLQYLDGRLNWWNKLKFKWYQYRNYIDRAKVFIMGVIPKYQEKGIEAGLTMKPIQQVRAQQSYQAVELSWVGDFNPKMLALHKATGARQIHEHITLSKTINRNDLL